MYAVVELKYQTAKLGNVRRKRHCWNDPNLLTQWPSVTVVSEAALLVHGQVTIIFVVSVALSICLSVCLFVQSFSQPPLIRFRSN